MKQRFFSVKLYVEGIRQLKVVGVIFLIIATLVNCILPLIELLVKAGVFEMESPTTEASALDMSHKNLTPAITYSSPASRIGMANTKTTTVSTDAHRLKNRQGRVTGRLW